MVTQSVESRAKSAAVKPPVGIVLELDTLALPGRQALFEACQKALKPKGIALTPVLASRYLMDVAIPQGLARLGAAFGADLEPVETLARDVQARYERDCASAKGLNPAMADLLKDAVRQDVRVGALSFLSEETVAALSKLLPEGVKVYRADKQAPRPTPDCWLATCKEIGVSPRSTVALATSVAACQSALEAGLRCVVVPDAFTSYQDISGADMVLDDLGALRIKDVQALLHPCLFR